MINTQPRYITVDDFNNYFGMDLSEMLKDNTNESNKANMFLVRVEDRTLAWIDNKTARNIPYSKLSAFQFECLQKALLHQALYTWQNGDLGLDSGYDQERGIIADTNVLNNIAVCPAAVDFLVRAGIFTHQMPTRKRYLSWGLSNEKGPYNPGPDSDETHIIG